uniref:Uncharacterized protein n=1 Tax=Proboscia inermis TaxID=420281 RepID=A0A7S0G866_9STRA|mmetsp:Transcript_10184/g.10311  ORF Transcript_10184/g.10311 Transcript_10184/m.10311 type:complete len:136 (+) Transcript_10184:106-513(+)
MQYFIAVAVLLSSSLGQHVSAFSPNTINLHRTMVRTTTTKKTSTPATQLFFNIIAPPDDENCELESSNCEESVFDRKKREKKEKDAGRQELYAEDVKAGLDLSSIDQIGSADQFDNAAGGGIIPGMQLTALMEDD